MLVRPAAIAVFVIATGLQASPFAWKSVNIQGMGYVTGLVIHPLAPHDIYIRTDVGGAYRFDRGARRWLPISDRSDLRATGFESIAVDPHDAATVYGFASGEVWVSHSRGAYWSATGLAAAKIYMGANDPYRGTTGEKLAVAGSRVYLGTRRNGMWVKDGGGAWQGVAAIPGGSDPGVTFVVTDPQSGRVAAGVWGSGVWISDDGGVTWRNGLSQSNPTRAAFASDGTLVVAFGGDEGGRSGSVRRFRNGAWSDITPFSKNDGYSGVTFSAWNPLELVVCANHDQTIYRSSDQGDSWIRLLIDGAPNQPGYYAKYASGVNTVKAAGWGNGTVTIDPVQPKRLLQTNGYGVIVTEDYTAARVSWSWWMANLEELVVQALKVPPLVTLPGTNEPGADLLSGVADMVGFRHARRDTPPSAPVAAFDWVAQATSIAYSAQHPEYAVFVGWDETSVAKAMTGFTSDNGKTWQPFGSALPGVGGAIAMSSADPKKLVWAPTHNAAPVFSSDGGQSWTQCKGIPASWQVSNEWWSAQIIAADPVDGNTFYFYNQGDVYGSSDAGATWTKLATIPGVQYTLKVSLLANPVKSGELWLIHKHNDNQPSPFPLYRSTDGGRTFVQVPGVAAANFLAFGKGKSADTPFLYLHGTPAGETQEAVYKSEDLAATWTRISDPAQQAFGSIGSLEADLRVQDLVYVGTGGRGIFYGYGPGAQIAGPSFDAGALKNAAGYQAGSVTPGEIVTLFGDQLGPSSVSLAPLDEAGFLSTAAGGAQVFFDGSPASMIYASRGQSSFLAPFGISGRGQVTVQVSFQDVLSQPVTVPIAASQPAIFTADSSGVGQAVAVNYSSGQLNAAGNTARRGDYVIFYSTGDGITDPVGVDGWIVAGSPPRTASRVSATIGGVDAPVVYAGAAPGFVLGVTQWNVQVPDAAPAGPAIPLSVTVGGVASPATVTIALQ